MQITADINKKVAENTNVNPESLPNSIWIYIWVCIRHKGKTKSGKYMKQWFKFTKNTIIVLIIIYCVPTFTMYLLLYNHFIFCKCSQNIWLGLATDNYQSNSSLCMLTPGWNLQSQTHSNFIPQFRMKSCPSLCFIQFLFFIFLINKMII